MAWGLRRFDELGRPRRFPWVGVTLLLAVARVAVRCQSFGGAFVDAGPELDYVRWRADGRPEPWRP